MNNTKRNFDSTQKYYFNHPTIWSRLRSKSVASEVNFLHKAFQHYGPIKRILDMGCGPGTHSHQLSKLGYKVTGLDINPKMLAYAKRYNSGPEYINADMRSPSLSRKLGKFDAIVCLCTTFTYSVSNAEVAASLNNFSSLLKPKGLLIIEVFNPIAFFQKIPLKKSFFPDNQLIYSKFGLKVTTTHKVNETNQTLSETKRVYKLARTRYNLVQIDYSSHRLFFPKELEFFLTTSGFKVLIQLGDYDIRHKNLSTRKIITIARKVQS